MSAIDDINTNIKKAIPELNNSKASIIGRITQVIGTFIDIVRLEMLRSQQIMDQSLKDARITTSNYYISKAYAYQEGDNLIVKNELTQELTYDPIIPANQIIKQASINVTSLGVFYINVATTDKDGMNAPLSLTQINAFRSYFNNFVAVGADMNASSLTPAIFTANNLYIRYNKNYNLLDIQKNIKPLLINLQQTNRPNGVLYVNEAERILIGIEGVLDASFATPYIIWEGESIYPTAGQIDLPPGYFNFDPLFYDFDTNKTIFEPI